MHARRTPCGHQRVALPAGARQDTPTTRPPARQPAGPHACERSNLLEYAELLEDHRQLHLRDHNRRPLGVGLLVVVRRAASVPEHPFHLRAASIPRSYRRVARGDAGSGARVHVAQAQLWTPGMPRRRADTVRPQSSMGPWAVLMGTRGYCMSTPGVPPPSARPSACRQALASSTTAPPRPHACATTEPPKPALECHRQCGAPQH